MLKSLDGSIIAMLILLIMLIQVYDKSKFNFSQYRLFTYMAVTNLVLIFMDLFTWHFDGKPGSLNLLGAYITNTILFSMSTIPSAIFVLYTNELISFGTKRLNKLKVIIKIIVIFSAVLSLISVFTGWYYYIDSDNIYHRGKFFYVHEAICVCLMAYSMYVIIKNRKSFEKRHFTALLMFCFPAAAGIIIQTLFYGYSAVVMGLSLSLLIVYISIQLRNLNTDYLTGVSNRRYLDEYLADKINRSRKKAFSVIMIDVDAFKLINDNFGHEIGDMALKDSVSILKSSLNKDDFIARMGGDEFIMIIDTSSQQALEQTVKRIKENITEFNSKNTRPYSISFSFGYSVYDINLKLNSGEFINKIDMLMYEDKKKKA